MPVLHLAKHGHFWRGWMRQKKHVMGLLWITKHWMNTYLWYCFFKARSDFSSKISFDLVPSEFFKKCLFPEEECILEYPPPRFARRRDWAAKSSVSWAQYSSSGWWFMVLSWKIPFWGEDHGVTGQTGSSAPPPSGPPKINIFAPWTFKNQYLRHLNI